jgi:hypothetical protein
VPDKQTLWDTDMHGPVRPEAANEAAGTLAALFDLPPTLI